MKEEELEPKTGTAAESGEEAESQAAQRFAQTLNSNSDLKRNSLQVEDVVGAWATAWIRIWVFRVFGFWISDWGIS